jgi:hypothetical protein
MNRTLTVLTKTALVIALVSLGLASSAWAQQHVPAPSGKPANDAPMPGAGKSTSSTIPDKATPRSDNEAGPQSPPEHSRTTPPLGAAEAPNPKTPKSVNEAADAHPEKQQGATSGSTGMGMKRRSDSREMNR